MRLYLDSNVFLSYVLKEFGGIEDFMENTTEEFFKFCAEENHVIVLSDLFFSEVKKRGFHTKKEILELIATFGAKTKLIAGGKKDLIKAGKLQEQTGIHGADAYHMRMAVKSKSSYIVTWNLKDFKNSPVKAASPNAFKRIFSAS